MSALGIERDVTRPTRIELPDPPGWVHEALGTPGSVLSDASPDPGVRFTEGSGLTFLRVSVPGARFLDDAEFQAAARCAYASVAEALQTRKLIPLRFWNYLPGIRDRQAGGLSRYEIFNAGRFEGFRDWLVRNDMRTRLPAASAVDHDGDELVVHLLASDAVGRPVENPRQTPAYRYSRRYGPVPPCFSRATLLEGALPPALDGRWALVAGTASIVGEDSMHANNVAAQIRETLGNLASLSDAVFAAAGDGAPIHGLETSAAMRAFARYRELRTYVVREDDVPIVVAALQRFFPHLTRLEVASAGLCRRELLVEVEGIAASDE
jgi:chorismate lyase/3-hydroxybenzoate synthase